MRRIGDMAPPIEEDTRRYRRMTRWTRIRRVIKGIQVDTKLNISISQAQVGLFMAKVSALIDRIGVYTDLHHQYLAYALALDKSQRDMAFMVDLIREHQILRDRFERRGLDPSVLSQIDRLVIYRTTDY